jgi:hypothetical protein
MKALLTAALIATLAVPAFAGGPVIVEDVSEVVAEGPASSIGAIVPLILLVAIVVAVSGGGGDKDACAKAVAIDC